MHRLQRHLPFLYHLFMKIKEPRIRRLIYFVIYILLSGIATVTMFFKTPEAFVHVLGGVVLVYFSGTLIVVGALVCAVSVLPGIWMFERAGLVAIASGIAMYSMFLIVLGASAMVAVVPAIFILFFLLRWLDIWEYLLAPKEG